MSFTSQKYKKYFTLNHNGTKNVRTVQTIASIGVEMMPAGADVGCGWVYINKVGLRCICLAPPTVASARWQDEKEQKQKNVVGVKNSSAVRWKKW